MDKRFTENTNIKMVESIENMTGKSMSAGERRAITHGADEVDLVNSGLEETMISSFHDIRNALLAHKKVKDHRTAAFIVSINKVASSYMNLGIWP